MLNAASRFPDDPRALSIAFEAQRLAGRSAEAKTIAARWAAVAPGDGMAIAAQATVAADALVAAKSTDGEQWAAIRRQYAAAAKAVPDRPWLLREYYMTYRHQGVVPPVGAQNALYAAFKLLPQDDDLRYRVAADFEQRGMIDDAITIIRPTAFESADPNEMSPAKRARRERDKARYRLAGADDGETAREMLVRLEAKKAKAKPTG